MDSPFLDRFSTTGGKPIFLHFLNRELHDAVGKRVHDALYLQTVRSCTVLHNEPMFANISQQIETADIHSALMSELILLSKQPIFLPYSDFDRIEEFLQSRRALYQHDRNRYPIYFDHAAIRACGELTPIKQDTGNTTKYISDSVKKWSHSQPNDVERLITKLDSFSLRALSEQIGSICARSEGRAMTYATFRETELGKTINPQEEGALRRALSGLYVNHYVKNFRALTILGLPSIEYFDTKHNEPMLCNSTIEFIMRFTGLHSYLNKSSSYAVNERIEYYDSTEKMELHYATKRLSVAIRQLNSGGPLRKINWETMNKVVRIMLDAAGRLPEQSRRATSYPEALKNAAQRINGMCNMIKREEEGVRSALSKSDSAIGRLLIATATDTEDKIALNVLNRHEISVVDVDFNGRSSIRYFGIHRGVEVFHVRSSSGSGGPSGAQEVVGEAIDRIRPNFIISAGICAGLVPSKQKIGDIAVSTALRDYEAQRVGSGGFFDRLLGRETIIPRGPRPDAGPLLLDRARHCYSQWGGAKVHFGIFLSGDKLVDSQKFRKAVLKIEPEAVALEMEGAGISAVAARQLKEWIIVKGICDFAASKTKDHQEIAAENAFAFLTGMIKAGGLSAVPYGNM